MATNLQLRCRELEGLLAAAAAEGVYAGDRDIFERHLKSVAVLRRSSELLLYKLDDMCVESTKAHQGLLLFLQVHT